MRLSVVIVGLSSLFGQVITSSESIPTICGEAASFSITVVNNSTQSLSSPQLAVSLPEGIAYVPGSVSPGTVQEISTSPPIFGLPTLNPQSSLTLTFSVTVGCDIIPLLDNQNSQVSNIYALTWDGGGPVTYTTPNYTVLRPALIYQSITNQSFVTSTAPTTFTRIFTIKNSGTGRLSIFYHKETAGNGIQITGSSGGTVVNLSPQLLELKFEASDFAAIGNGDPYFDPNESLTFSVTYEITSCYNLNSTFELRWGCGGTDCAVETQTGGAAVTASGLVPNIVTSNFPAPYQNAVVFLQESSCYPDQPGNSSRMRFRAVNAGTGPAYNLQINLYVLPLPPFNMAANPIARIDTHSLQLRIGSNGPLLPRRILSSDAGPANNCFGVPDVVRRLTLQVDMLDSGDTLYIDFDHYTCNIPCQGGTTIIRQIGWDLSYRSACNDSYTLPPASSGIRTRHGATLINSHPSSVIEGQPFNVCISVDGSPGNYWRWEPPFPTISGAPSNLNYFYTWRIDLPPGVTYTGALPLEWVGTLSNNTSLHWAAKSVQQIGQVLQVTFDHDNRPAGWNDEAYAGSYLCIPLTFTCGQAGNYTITSRLFYNPNPTCNPGLGYCYGMQRSTEIGLNCASACPNGVEFIDFSVRRTSYGLPDNDNDGIPDNNGSLDFSRIRLDRMMVTDTALVRFRGVVRSPNGSWEYLWAHMEISDQGDRFQPAFNTATIRIYKASTQTSYEIQLPLINDAACSSFPNCHRFAVNLGAAQVREVQNIPQDFVWENGDSVEVFIRIYVATNPGNSRWQVRFTPLLYAVNTNQGLGAQAAPHPADQRIGCGAHSAQIELLGYALVLGDALVESQGCPDPPPLVQYSYNFVMGNLGNCNANHFPYEYRQWTIPATFRVTLPSGWRYVPGSSQLVHRRTLGTPNNQGAQCLEQQTAVGAIEPVDPNSSTLIFNTSTLFGTGPGQLIAGDDGFTGTLRFRVRPTCAVAIDQEQYVPVRVSFTGRLEQIRDARPLPNGYRLLYRGPRLSVEAITNPVSAVQHTVEWRIKVSNTSNVSSAPYSFLFFTALNGGLTVVSVIDVATNTPINPTGGYYPIGNVLAGGDRYFLVRAQISSCPDTLIARVGWDCQGYPTPLSSYPCLNSAPSARLTFLPTTPTFFINSSISPNPSELCEELTLEVEVSNGGSGYAYQPRFYFILPPGMNYVSGSGEIQYPSNAAWTAIPDPNTFFFILRFWDLSGILPALSGGLPNTSDNKYKLRFRVATTCQYVSGSQIRFYASGSNVCGTLRGQIGITNPVVLSNVISPYNTSITPLNVEIVGCQTSTTYTVEITNLGTNATGTDDSIRVVIPGGVYVSNSTENIENFNPHEPVVKLDGGNTILTWEIPAGINMGEKIRFRFAFRVDPALPDGEYTLTVQSLINATRSCGNNGDCNIFYSTGTANSVLTVVRPVGKWTGEVSDDWSEPLNWGDCAVPSCSKDVTIPPTIRQPHIRGEAFCRNITIQNGARLTIDGVGQLDICGDYFLEGGATLVAGVGSKVRFRGSSTQRYKSEGEGNPYHLEMAQMVAGHRLILQTPLTIDGDLTLTRGVIDGYTQGKETFVRRAAADAVSTGNEESYVSGRLRRAVNTTSVDGWYYLPVGHLSSGKGYQRGEIRFREVPADGELVAYFLPWPFNPPPKPEARVDCGAPFGDLSNLDNGYWVIQKSGSSIPYDIRLYARNYTNASGQGYAVVKRPEDAPNLFGFEGKCEGSPYDKANQTGRLALTTFSEFAIAQSPTPLATQFIYVRSLPREKRITLSYALRQDWNEVLSHEIERSTDDSSWKTIEKLSPDRYRHREGDIGYYEWEDIGVDVGQRYLYRIRVHQRGGNDLVSPVVEATIAPSISLRATIVPNPSSEEAWLELSSSGHPVRIWTLAGTLVWEGYAESERLRLPRQELSAGIYIVEVDNLRIRWVKNE